MWPNPQETADLVTFTQEIRNEKLHFFVQCKIMLEECEKGNLQLKITWEDSHLEGWQLSWLQKCLIFITYHKRKGHCDFIIRWDQVNLYLYVPARMFFFFGKVKQKYRDCKNICLGFSKLHLIYTFVSNNKIKKIGKFSEKLTFPSP